MSEIKEKLVAPESKEKNETQQQLDELKSDIMRSYAQKIAGEIADKTDSAFPELYENYIMYYLENTDFVGKTFTNVLTGFLNKTVFDGKAIDAQMKKDLKEKREQFQKANTVQDLHRLSEQLLGKTPINLVGSQPNLLSDQEIETKEKKNDLDSGFEQQKGVSEATGQGNSSQNQIDNKQYEQKESRENLVKNMLDRARNYLGKPYVRGGRISKGSKGTDCGGLLIDVLTDMGKLNKNFNSRAGGLAQFCDNITQDPKSIKAGSIVFMKNAWSPKMKDPTTFNFDRNIYHVAIATGPVDSKGRIPLVHAANRKAGVIEGTWGFNKEIIVGDLNFEKVRK